MQLGDVNVVFKKLVHKIVDQIKNEPFFRWLKKIEGDPSRQNQNLYCTYHWDKGHTTEQCRVLKDHMGQLVKAGHLKEFVVELGNRGPGLGAQQRGNPVPPPLGIIEVIHAMPGSKNAVRTKVSIVASTGDFSEDQPPTKRTKGRLEPIAIDDEDLEGTIQPHDDALAIAARISGFLVKRVMIDQGSGANVMYPDLFKGLGLKNQDLAKYDSLLVSFDGRVVILQGQISLLVSMEGKKVITTFIVVSSFSPYTVILGRLWIHAMGAILSTLHIKVKFRTKRGVATVRGNQKIARQCLIAAAH